MAHNKPHLRIFVVTFVVAVVGGNDLPPIDQQWKEWLETPPPQAIQAGSALYERAQQLISSLPSQVLSGTGLGDIDVVVSGGGDYDGFYMGIHMILDLVQAKNSKLLHVTRWGGASAGGMMPFELALKGTNITLLHHLAYGYLEDVYAPKYKDAIEAAYLQDHHWREMSIWMTTKWNTSLHNLDDRVYLALTCLDPILPKLVTVSKFITPTQAASAFMATGTYIEEYDNMVCSDGGAESGPNMTPLFQDNLHPQLVISLLHTGFPAHMVFKYTMEEAIKIISYGQDTAIAFLKCGVLNKTCYSDSIAVCPRNSDTKSNVCKSK
eukprot:m.24341 g.24341  ORF g.24341 m.24341 type:complete len:323 (+) comp7600_c0_seq1:92-1060(+)